jgi:RNase P/RNase MRP subunit POP5
MKLQKKRIRALPSSMRIKKRYILVAFNAEHSFSQQDLHYALQETTLELYGSVITPELNLQLVDFKPSSNRAIIRCARDQLDRVKTAVLFLKHVSNKPVVPKILKASGSIKRLKEIK